LRLIEVAWPGSPWKSGFSGGEVVLVILVCLLGSAMWAGYRNGIHWNGEGLSVFGNEYDYPVSAKAPAAGMRRIVFDIARGNIKVTGADTQEVAVSGNKVIRSFGRRMRTAPTTTRQSRWCRRRSPAGPRQPGSSVQ